MGAALRDRRQLPSAGRRIHKVGLTASLAALAALTLLPFAVVAKSRIQTGAPIRIFSVAGASSWVLISCWLLVALMSLRTDGMVASALRALTACAAALLSLWVLNDAAGRLAAEAGTFARVSVGSGIWVAIFMVWAVVLASRREVGSGGWLAWLLAVVMPAGLGVLLASGNLERLGVVMEYRNVSERYWAEVARHLVIAGSALALASAVGITLGLLAHSFAAVRRPVTVVANLFQTVPGLALIGLLVVPFSAVANRFPVLRGIGVGGLGWAPVVLALTLYGLLPVVRNTLAGLDGVSPASLEAGRGMGMTGGQLLRRVQLPLAAPVVFSGVRTTAEQAVGNGVLGAFAAAGGLGLFVFQGLSQQAPDLILLGALGVMGLALIVDGVMRLVQAMLERAGRGGPR